MNLLTPKQSALLNFIYLYRFNHGCTPALKEMVAELDISDNKSALRMIDALVEKGYLVKGTEKTKTVTLSDKGYQLVSSIPVRYEKRPAEIDKVRLPDELGQSGISVSLPVSNTLGYQEQKLDPNGTDNAIDINTVVETAVTLVIGKYLSGTQIGQSLRQAERNDLISFVKNAIRKVALVGEIKWSLILVFLTWAFKLIVNDTLVAFCYSIFGTLFIKYLLRGNYESGN